ncbi:MAG: hypothetical protein AAF360_10685 [Pseudomonadota bacterium]
MKRAIGLFLALLIIAVAAYLSRFWIFDWWGRDGLFGLSELRPGGDLWRRWMRMLGLAPYDVVLWALAGFALLTGAQSIWNRLDKSD